MAAVCHLLSGGLSYDFRPMSLRFNRMMDRFGISRRKMKGGRLHRWLGDHLFSKELWLLHRDSVAWGWLIGVLASTSPFLGFQMVLALPFVFIFRANVLVTFGLIWLTNPVTAPIFYGCALLVGMKVLGHSAEDLAYWRHAENLNLSPELITQFWGDIFGPILLGTTLLGLLLAVPGFFLIKMFWPAPKPRGLKQSERPPSPRVPVDANDRS
jgi:uncharacterized protein (DUF2062 family)